MKLAKWVLGGLGWTLGGPIGALLGFVFGVMYDDIQGEKLAIPTGQQPADAPRKAFRKAPTTEQDFVVSLLVLTAYTMKADGKVVRGELDFVKSFLRNQFGEDRASEYVLLLRDLLNQPFSIREVTMQIKAFMPHAARLQMLHYLFGIARSDHEVAGSEVEAIHKVAHYLGISEKDYASIRAMFYTNPDAAFTVLEIPTTASNEEVKRAYRKLAAKHHPDKVSGMGESIEKAAHEKFVRIQQAYETIRKQRGFA